MMELIRKVEAKSLKEELPDFRVGDVVDVHVRIREGEKERVQIFSGTVIKFRGGKGIRGAFTVRRIVQGEGVERVFPIHCPSVQNVVVKRPGAVRRSKRYYLRGRVGKATKVKERREPRPESKSAKKKTKKKARKNAEASAE